MIILYAGLIIFFGLHFYSVFRSRVEHLDIKQRIGTSKYMGLYSLGSTIGLALIIWGYMQAPTTAYLFNGFGISKSFKIALMAAAFILITASQLPAGNIKRVLKHPMLIGVGLWAIAHLFDGANLKQTLLFGSFLIFSVIASLATKPSKQSTAEKSKHVAQLKFDVASALIGSLAFYVTVTWLHVGLEAYLYT